MQVPPTATLTGAWKNAASTPADMSVINIVTDTLSYTGNSAVQLCADVTLADSAAASTIIPSQKLTFSVDTTPVTLVTVRFANDGSKVVPSVSTAAAENSISATIGTVKAGSDTYIVPTHVGVFTVCVNVPAAAAVTLFNSVKKLGLTATFDVAAAEKDYLLVRCVT